MAIQSPSLEISGAAPVRAALTPASRGYWQSVRRRLGRDPVTLICAAVLLLIVTFFFMALGTFFGIFEEVIPLVPPALRSCHTAFASRYPPTGNHS